MKTPMRVALVYTVKGIEKRKEFVLKSQEDYQVRLNKVFSKADEGSVKIVWGVYKYQAKTYVIPDVPDIDKRVLGFRCITEGFMQSQRKDAE